MIAPAASAGGEGVNTRKVVFLHSSAEMYGSDRMLLAVLDTLPTELQAEVWLPDDVMIAPDGLVEGLTARGIPWRVQSLPVLRRRYLTPSGLLGLLRRQRGLARLLRTAGPDAVYLATSALLTGASAARRAGAKTVIVHVQEIWSGLEGRLLGLLGRSLDLAICISRPVQQSMVGPLARRAEVIANAVPDASAALAPLTGRSGPLRFVVASRWNAWKGHSTLLEAWDAAQAPGILTILGGPPPVGSAVDVPKLVSALRHPDSVEIRGEVPSILDVIDASDVVIVPSDSPEPFGLVAIEAFSRGRAVIASDGGGLADIVEDGSTGWLFGRKDADALRTILESLNRDDVERAGLHAREAYEARYSLARFSAEFRTVWGRIGQ